MKNKDVLDILKRTYSQKAPDILPNLRFDMVEKEEVVLPPIRRRYIAAVAIYTAACLVIVSVLPFVIRNSVDPERKPPSNSNIVVETDLTRMDVPEDSTYDEMIKDETFVETKVPDLTVIIEDTAESDPEEPEVTDVTAADTSSDEVSVETTPDVDDDTQAPSGDPEVTVTGTDGAEPDPEETTAEITTEEPAPEPVKLTSDEAREIVRLELEKEGIVGLESFVEVFERGDSEYCRVQFVDTKFTDYNYVSASTTGFGNRPESVLTKPYSYEYRYIYDIDLYTGEIVRSDRVFTGEAVEGTKAKSNFYIDGSVPYTYYIYNGKGMPELSRLIDAEYSDSSVIGFNTAEEYYSFVSGLREAAHKLPKDDIGAGALNFLYQEQTFDLDFFEEYSLYLFRLDSEDVYKVYNFDSVTVLGGELNISVTELQNNWNYGTRNEQFVMIVVEKYDLYDVSSASLKLDRDYDVNIDEEEAKELAGTYGASKGYIEALIVRRGYDEKEAQAFLDRLDSDLAPGDANVFDYVFDYGQIGEGNVPFYVTEHMWMPHFETAYNVKCVINASDGSLIDITISDPIDDYTPSTREVYVPRVPYENDEIMYTHGVTYSYYEYSDESIAVLQNMIDLDTSEHNVKHAAGANPRYKSILGFNDKAKFDSFVSEFDSANLDGYMNSEAEAFLKDLEKYDEEYFKENNLYLISLEDIDSTIHYMYWMQVKFPRRTSYPQFEPYLTLDAIGVDYGIRTGERLNKLVLFEVSREEVYGTSNLEVWYIEDVHTYDQETAEPVDTLVLPYIYHPKKYYYLTKDN